jgi:hypothetical protein
MEPTPQIKLPIPYEPSGKETKTFKKIDTKLKSLNKTGSKKVLTFFGSPEIQTMFYLYLLKKYKSKCFIRDENRILGINIEIKKQYNPYENQEMLNQLNKLAQTLIGCIKNPDTKIIIIPVSLKFEKNSHANVLIYRKNLIQIEHFEPHGKYFSGEEFDTNDMMINSWMSKFVSVLNEKLRLNKNPEVKFIESSEVCPYIDGLQNLESWSKLPIIANVEPKGYCAAWSMFFTELCLKNPNIPSSTLMDYIFNTLEDMAYSEKKDYLRRVIRGYSVFINEKISKYFSILFGDNFTAEKIKNFPSGTKQKLKNILHDLIELEMILVTNPNYVKKYIEEISRGIEVLNRSLQNNQDIRARANIENKLVILIGRKNLYNAYERFNVFSNPSETISQRENSSPILKKMNATNFPKPEKIKSCPEGKEINPKTGRCVKSKTQKVRKDKTPKQQVKTYTVPEPKKIEVPVVPETKKIQSCPEGKEINPKTGRCVKTKTQKVKTPLKNKEIVCPEGCIKKLE